MNGGPVTTNFESATDGARVVPSRDSLPQAIRTAPTGATIEVKSEALMELGQTAADPISS